MLKNNALYAIISGFAVWLYGYGLSKRNRTEEKRAVGRSSFSFYGGKYNKLYFIPGTFLYIRTHVKRPLHSHVRRWGSSSGLIRETRKKYYCMRSAVSYYPRIRVFLSVNDEERGRFWGSGTTFHVIPRFYSIGKGVRYSKLYLRGRSIGRVSGG